MTWRAELRQLTAAGMSPRYPWRLWLGSTCTLVRGKDYHVPSRSLQTMAHHAAERMRVRVRVKATEGEVVIVALEAAE